MVFARRGRKIWKGSPAGGGSGEDPPMLKLVRWFSEEKRAAEFRRGVSIAYLEGPSLTSIYKGSKADSERIDDHVNHVPSYNTAWASLNDSEGGRAFYSICTWLRRQTLPCMGRNK